MATGDDDLLATSDAILRNMDRLTALELEKRGLTPDDLRMAELTAKTVSLGKRLRELTLAEQAIVQGGTRARGPRQLRAAPTRNRLLPVGIRRLGVHGGDHDGRTSRDKDVDVARLPEIKEGRPPR